MSQASASGRVEPPEPSFTLWLGFVCMIVGNFMAILDIQIVASALAQIQAGVAASPDEISWVQTSYLIAEVIALPLSGFLGRALGIRLLFAIASAGFAIMSAACALAWDLNSLIVFRTLQGFIGGAMIPTTMAVVYLIFPTHRLPMAMALIGLVSTMAPSLGPTLGGWIAETTSWRWLFWVNVVPGLVIAFLVYRWMRIDRPDWRLLRRIDLAGLFGLAFFLGALQKVLEDGPSHEWFASEEIWFFSLLSALGAILFFWRARASAEPIVDLRVFANRNFAVGAGLGLIVGFGLYGPVFLQPLFMANVQHFNALEIGHHMFAQGVAMFLTAPVVARMRSTMTDPRPVASLGFALVAVSCFLQTGQTAETGFWDYALPQAMRGVGMMLTFTGIMAPAMATLPPRLVHSATGIFNLMRNLGGAFGLALLLTAQSFYFALHRQELYASSAATSPETQAMLAAETQRLANLGIAEPAKVALARYVALLDREAAVMTFNNLFLILAIALAIAALGVWLMRGPPKDAPGPDPAAQAAAH
jgi:DHA2 family multidrug resistance protein